MKLMDIKKISMKKAVIVIVLLELLVLGFIAGKREWILWQGESVYLRTAPVDPRDIFRGDYVKLEYEIAYPEEGLVSEHLLNQTYQEVFLRLKRDKRGIAQVTGIETKKPEGLFIKGYLDKKWRFQWRNRGLVKLGIEKYFVQ